MDASLLQHRRIDMAYPKLVGNDLLLLLKDAFKGDSQNLAFFFQSGYISGDEYEFLRLQGLQSFSDFDGYQENGSFYDENGRLNAATPAGRRIHSIGKKASEAFARVMSLRLGMPYIGDDEDGGDQSDKNTEFKEIELILQEAWSDDPSFTILSYAPNRNMRAVVTLMKPNELTDKFGPFIEVYTEEIELDTSRKASLCRQLDETYTYYELHDRTLDDGNVMPNAIMSALRDFVQQKDQINGGEVQLWGSEELDQYSEIIVSTIGGLESR